MANLSFNSSISSRTQCVEHILGNPDQLAVYESLGGVKEDLESIAANGHLAESHKVAQLVSGGSSSGSGVEVAQQLQAMQSEYYLVKCAVHATRLDLAKSDAPAEILSTIDAILANSTELTFRTEEIGGTKKRKASVSRSSEAVRNEIESDATALIGLTPAHEALARRKVTVERLTALQSMARALAGKLASRTSKKGSTRVHTQAEHEAVRSQSEVWAACYRILALVGARDPTVKTLLKEASRGRK